METTYVSATATTPKGVGLSLTAAIIGSQTFVTVTRTLGDTHIDDFEQPTATRDDAIATLDTMKDMIASGLMYAFA